jgi:hypothetical protein
MSPSVAQNPDGVVLATAGTYTINVLKAQIISQELNEDNVTLNESSGSAPHWKPWCYLTSCNPGGSGSPSVTPTQTWYTSGSSDNGVPYLSSSADNMELATTSSKTVHQTNTLMTFIAGTDCDSNCWYFKHDFNVYFPSATFANYSASEHDHFWFDLSDEFRYMFGAQYCFTGCPSGTAGWDFGGNSNVPWTLASTKVPLTSGSWNHVVMLTHRIPSEVTSKPCKDENGDYFPYLYYDAIAVGPAGGALTVDKTGWQYCANADPSGWSGLGDQHQQDIYGENLPVTEYYSTGEFTAYGEPATLGSGVFIVEN